MERPRIWVALAAGFLFLVHLALLAASARVADCARDEIHYLNSGRIVREHGWVNDATVLQGPLPLFFNQVLVGCLPPGGFSPAEDQGDLLWRGRLGTLPFALLAAALVFLWSRSLFGDAGGVLSLLFHALNPIVLGYGALLLVDAQCAALVTLVLFLLWRFLETRSWLVLTLLGTALGLALATKYLSLLLLPTVGTTVALAGMRRVEDAASSRPVRILAGVGRAAAVVLFVAATALLALHACYGFQDERGSVDPGDYRSHTMRALVSVPFLGSFPALLPGPFARGADFQVSQGERPWLVYVDGEIASGHADYYLRAILYKTPEATLLAAAIVLLCSVRRVLRRDRDRRWGTAILATVPSLVVWVGYLSFFTRMQLGIRYVLPIYPVFFVALGSLWSRGVRWRRAPFLAVCALVAGLHARDLVLNWPDWITYCNTASGGRRLAFRHLLESIGSSGQNLQNGGELLRERFGPLQLLDARSGARFGRLAIDADSLAWPDPEDPTRSRFDWLMGLDPLGHVATSWWVFEVTPDALEKRLGSGRDEQLRRALALAYLGVGRLEDARRHLAHLDGVVAAPLERLLILLETAARDSGPETARALLHAWMEVGRLDHAGSVLGEHPALASSPRGIEARVLARMEEHDWTGVLALLESLQGLEIMVVRIGLVLVLQELGQHERALAELDRVLEDPAMERARPPLLVVRAGLERWAEYYAWLR